MPRQVHEVPGLTASGDRFDSLLKPLLTAAAAVLLALVFVRIGSEVVEGDTLSFDLYLLRGALGLRSEHPWLVEVMRDLSGLGSTVTLTLLTVAAVLYLALFSARSSAVLVASSVISGSVLVSLFKIFIGRSRPASDLAESVVPGLSFPSGHASISAIVFLTLGALVAGSRSRLSERVFILGMAALSTALVGLSRVVLGVHWATDVLGGWAFGSAWAAGWLLVARWLTRR